MMKKIFGFVVLAMAITGIVFGIWFTIKKSIPNISQKEVEEKIFSMIQTKTAEATNFYTYGRAFNLKGKITNVTKDNFENVKLVITDGKQYEKECILNYEFEDTTLNFVSTNEMNAGIILDELDPGEYYVLLRLKLNNSNNPRYYSFSNSSKGDKINYYSITKDGKNNLAEIDFCKKTFKENEYNLLSINVKETSLPNDVFDIVIDAGHGGSDKGEKENNITEADVALEYAKLLKTSLEEKGYKVALTRDDDNSGTYTYTNMYDTDGRITEACRTRAKLMISFHINQGSNGLRGLEIYCPGNSNLNFAKEMANKINEYSGIEFSNNNSFKKAEGVYVRNFTKNVIKEYANTANQKGYAPYDITTNTSYLYTIREVGGVATGAYVDGRNTAYDANQYYDSNQGIECYQLELGYIKNDLDLIVNRKSDYITAITEAICNNF